MQNVHEFDGKLRGLFTPVKKHSVEEKEDMFNKLATRLTPPAVHMLAVMIVDMKKPNGGANYHPASDADATDILADIVGDNKYDDILPTLDEQLEDIKNLGTCDSGRVTRMFQVWQAYIEGWIEKLKMKSREMEDEKEA